MKKIVIGLSGGMDSTTLLGYLLEQGYQVHCCSFIYGSKHGSWEYKAACEIYQYYKTAFPVEHHTFDLTQSFKNFQSYLLQSGGEIPEGHYNEESMKQTVVPGRNLIFASLMAGLAESIGAEEVALGVHSGDHHIYPDCRPEFIQALGETIKHSTEKKVTIFTPFIYIDKAKILKIGYSLPVPVPYHLTRTCYKDQPLACGKCGSCQERLEAFEKINKKDLIQYEK
jgi:7-cyano-7-deazaguanine synthase